jgi:hypothetical protein
MTTTDNQRDQPADAQLSWFDMEPAAFDTAAPLVQGALFAKPDTMGTPALFGDVFGTDL